MCMLTKPHYSLYRTHIQFMHGCRQTHPKCTKVCTEIRATNCATNRATNCAVLEALGEHPASKNLWFGARTG